MSAVARLWYLKVGAKARRREAAATNATRLISVNANRKTPDTSGDNKSSVPLRTMSCTRAQVRTSARSGSAAAAERSVASSRCSGGHGASRTTAWSTRGAPSR